MTEKLPDYARQPWPQMPQPDPSAARPTPPPPKPRGDRIAEQIAETHVGVQNLQTLLDEAEAEGPSKIDTIVSLLEQLVAGQKSLEDGLDLLFNRQTELFRQMKIRIPPSPAASD